MSLRTCLPSNAISDAPAKARSRARWSVGAVAVTPSTRPPATTSRPSRSAVPACCTLDAGERLGALDALDRLPGARGLRVAGSGQHECHSRVVADVEVDLVGRAVGDRRERGCEIAVEARDERLRLGIAEAHVVLEHPRARRR